MSKYDYLLMSTGNCVHFMDKCPNDGELQELSQELRKRSVAIVYVDCLLYTGRKWEIPNSIGYAAEMDHPPYDRDGEPHWLRWWDDLLSLGYRSKGLAIVLDNANAIFETDRKFMTDLLESFLHGMKPWMEREVPYHLCFQMVPCPGMRKTFSQEPLDET